MKTNTSRRVIAVVTLLALSGITGAVSYLHGLDVVRSVGNAGVIAFLIPVIPDLMIIAASMSLLEASANGLRRSPAAIAALVVGIGWTIAANVVAGTYGGVGGALIAGGVPVGFLLTLETLLWLVRHSRAAAPESAQDVMLAAHSMLLDTLEAHRVLAEAEHIIRAAESALVSVRVPEQIVIPETAPDTAPEPLEEHPLPDDAERAESTSKSRAPRKPRSTTSSKPKGAPKGTPEEYYAGELSRGEVPSIRSLKTTWHLGADRAKELHEELSSKASHPAGKPEMSAVVPAEQAVQPALALVGGNK